MLPKNGANSRRNDKLSSKQFVSQRKEGIVESSSSTPVSLHIMNLAIFPFAVYVLARILTRTNLTQFQTLCKNHKPFYYVPVILWTYQAGYDIFINGGVAKSLKHRSLTNKQLLKLLKFIIAVPTLFLFPVFPCINHLNHQKDPSHRNKKRESDNVNMSNIMINTTKNNCSTTNDPDTDGIVNSKKALKATSIKYENIKNPFIMLIGISTFDKDKVLDIFEITNLPGVKKDMASLKTLFQTHYNEAHVRDIQSYLKQKDDTFYVTRYDIVHFLNDCAVQLNKMKTQAEDKNKININNNHNISGGDIDSLIIYYSGHGFENNDTIDSDGEIFSLDEFKYQLKDTLKDKPKLYFFDCCRHLQIGKVDENEAKRMETKGAVSQVSLFDSRHKKEIDFQNIMSFYATADGKYINEDETGSKMKRAIMKCFNHCRGKEKSYTLHELSMLLKNEIQQDMENDTNLQIPEVSNFFTKEYNISM